MNNHLKVFLLGVIATLLLTFAVREVGAAFNQANAADHAVAGSTIALVSPLVSGGNTKIGLILIDTTVKNMAFYIADDTKMFSLVAARHYSFDLGIKDIKYNMQGYPVMEDKDWTKISSSIPQKIKNAKSAKEMYDEFIKK